MGTEEFDLQSVLSQIMGDEPIELTKKITTVTTTETVTAPAVKQILQGVVTDAQHQRVGSVGTGASTMDAVPVDEDDTEDTKPVSTLLSFPTFTEDNLSETMDIRNFATLCKLRVRKWVGKRRDKNAARTAESNSGAVNGAFSAYKKLFAGTEDKLRAVNSVLDAARTRHYQMTLPWSTTSLDDAGRRDGPRLLANTLFMEYISEMGAAKQQMEAVFAELERSYPEMLARAKQNLGKAFDITQYPDAKALRHMFALDFEFSPIPEGADYRGLPNQQVQRLAEKLNKAKQLCMENALRDVWERAHTVVQKMAERLSNPKNTFHDTLVSNVRELADLLQHLNATQDKRIEHVRVKMEKDLCKYEPEVLRKDLGKRALIGKLAQELLQEMEAQSLGR